MNKKNQTLVELLTGIITLGIVIQLVCVFVSQNILDDSVGVWCGISVACFMAIHMKRSIEDEIDIGGEGAVNHARKAYVFRMVVALVVIGAVICLKLGNPITVVIGIFPLKLSAYLHPHIHKIFEKNQNKKGGRK